MGSFLLRRLWTMCWTLALVSALIFWIVNLPPGDVLTNQINQLRASGEASSVARAVATACSVLFCTMFCKILVPFVLFEAFATKPRRSYRSPVL